MTQHTKGPWFIKGTNPPMIYGDNDAMDIICQCDSMGEMSKAQEMANARLISVAPELLEVLEESLAAMERMDALLLKLTGSPKDCEKGEIVRARSIIAKAKVK